MTGEIRWRLGGKKSDFKMGPGATFGLQHDPRRQADGTISLFDDGTGPGSSRAIVLAVDETAMTATLVRAYPHPHGKFAMSQGNTQILPNGNVFVGWGSTGYASEFSQDGTVVLDADFSGSIQSYRCFRFPWVASPTGQPAIAADPPTSGLVTVYASWNGATEVASWEVLGGGQRHLARLAGDVSPGRFRNSDAGQGRRPDPRRPGPRREPEGARNLTHPDDPRVGAPPGRPCRATEPAQRRAPFSDRRVWHHPRVIVGRAA